MDANPYPALLTVGFHFMGISELRQLCVADNRFHRPTRRAKIMANLETLIGGLRFIGIEGKVWVDGSFLTEKIDPNDVDILLELDNETWDGLRANQRSDVEWLLANDEIQRELRLRLTSLGAMAFWPSVALARRMASSLLH